MIAPAPNGAVTFSIPEGKGTITAIKMNAQSNSGTAGGGCAIYWKNGRSYTFDKIEEFSAVGNTNTDPDAAIVTLTPAEGIKEFSIYKRVKVDDQANPTSIKTSSGKNFPSSTQTVNIASITITVTPECASNEFRYTGETTVAENAELTLAATSLNTGAFTYSCDNADATISGTTFKATKAGDYTVKVTQDGDGTHCAVNEEVIITVISTNPVTTAVVSGEETAFAGFDVTLTCTAENATAYQWYSNTTASNTGGTAISGATESTYTFTAVNGAQYYYCTAQNTFNSTPAVSNVITVTGGKLCGELAKAATDGTVSGIVGGTIDTNLGTGATKKLDKNRYFGIKLANGTLQAGDIVTIHVTAAADLGRIELFADNAGTTSVYAADSTFAKDGDGNPNGPVGDVSIILSASAAGRDAIYLWRENGNTQWNVTFDYISINRPCAASTDATLSSISVNGKAIEGFNAETLTYDVELSYDATELPVINYTTSHPMATAQVNNIDALPAGSDKKIATIVVKAEDETSTKTYTINFTKAFVASSDATLKSLTVGGKEITLEADKYDYTYEVAYGTTEVPAINGVPNDDNALSAVVTNATDLTGTSTIVVTAQDATTTKTYKVTFTIMAPELALTQIVFSNGFDAFIKTSETTSTVTAY
ncbi:MAG: cadherin-like beta sandwich domain-containing protein [Paludibacteraceae bacterium]|nr:cadherin-like beta sandwich domain-containing protein [Paludibacteraceae bacterium]